MPNLNEFLNKEKSSENIDEDSSVEIIEQMRPCSRCDLYSDSYKFNNQTLEMYWECKDGHQTRYSVG